MRAVIASVVLTAAWALHVAGPFEDPTGDDALSAATPTDCASIADDVQRLACYDALADEIVNEPERTYLDRHWDLSGTSRRFQPWSHRPNYVLPVHWTRNPNEAPFREAALSTGLEEPPDIQSVETKFQISFKTKLADGLFGGPAALWFGYTQQSHFQVYNRAESRPFRDTNFEPEAILVFPTRRRWGAWTWRVVGLGVVHQSNGRSEPLSRSWNRVYALGAVERGNLAIQIRPWVRFDSTDDDDDDNVGIQDHVGRLEASLRWARRGRVLNVRGRSNVKADGHRGSLQVDWFFPLRDRIRGHVQAFTGYGETLVDYDHRHNSVGVGLLLFDPPG